MEINERLKQVMENSSITELVKPGISQPEQWSEGHAAVYMKNMRENAKRIAEISRRLK